MPITPLEAATLMEPERPDNAAIARLAELELDDVPMRQLLVIWKGLYFAVFSMEGNAIPVDGTQYANRFHMHLPHLALEPSYARVNSDNIMWSREDLLTSINNLRQRVPSGAVVARPEEPALEPDISRRSKLKF